MKINLEKIENNLKSLRESYFEISKLLSLSTEELLLKRELIGALKYEMIVSVEAIVNILSHLLVKTRGITPQGYVDSIIKAKEQYLLSNALSQKLLSLVRLSNLLVHRYWDVDDELFLKNAKENKKDFVKFIEEIEALLKKEINKGEKDD